MNQQVLGEQNIDTMAIMMRAHVSLSSEGYMMGVDPFQYSVCGFHAQSLIDVKLHKIFHVSVVM